MAKRKVDKTLVSENYDVFLSMLTDIRDNDRGIRFPQQLDLSLKLDDVIFLICVDIDPKIFGVRDFGFGPTIKKDESIAENEAFIDVQRMYGQRDYRGVTLIYEMTGRNPRYVREYDRWKGMEYRKDEDE